MRTRCQHCDLQEFASTFSTQLHRMEVHIENAFWAMALAKALEQYPNEAKVCLARACEHLQEAMHAWQAVKPKQN